MIDSIELRGVARRFGDDDIKRILARAAEMQEQGALRAGVGGSGGLTLDDLREVAAEAGIDPRYVDLAATEQNHARASGVAKAWAGGDVTWTAGQLIDGEVRDEDRDRIIQIIRSTLGKRGDIADVYGRMEWTHDDGLGPIIVGVSSREGSTEIDVSVDRTGQASLIHALGVPLGGMAGGAVIIELVGLTGGPLQAIPVILATGGFAYLCARAAWDFLAGRWRRRTDRLIGDLARAAQDVAVPLALPSGSEEPE